MSTDQQDAGPAAIGGSVAPGFEGVRAAFEENFAQHGDVGAGCAVYVDGRQVVDLWGGVADATTMAPLVELNTSWSVSSV